MKKLWRLLAMIAAPPQLIHSREVKHAPTIEQCRADQKLWLSKIEETDYLPVSFRELQGWATEMEDCVKVDPDFRTASRHTECEVTATKYNQDAGFPYSPATHLASFWPRMNKASTEQAASPSYDV